MSLTFDQQIYVLAAILGTIALYLVFFKMKTR